MENEEEKPADIQLLPYDIIIMVLEYTSVPDILRFGSTCKQFNELVKESHALWKFKLRNNVNGVVYNEIEKYTDGNWYNEVKKYNILQLEVHDRIIDMAAYYYRYNGEINLYDIRQFLHNSYTNGLAYYCTIIILQEFLKRASKDTFLRFGNKPYSLTEMFYTKVALRHLFHPCLSIKWVQAHVRKDLPPVFVLNFFVQWVDPLKLHSDEAVNDAINSLASLVEGELKKIGPSKHLSIEQQCASGDISESQIIAAISHVIYKEKRMTPVSVANLETLDIVKVIEMGCGHDVVIAAIYSAVAKKFGVWCELIAFPNHLFLELRGSQNKKNPHIYNIKIDSGKVSLKRHCPFISNDMYKNDSKYCPDSLLQFIITAFLMPMGSYKTWYMQNATLLMDFLSTNPNSENTYRNYLPYLLDDSHLAVLGSPIELKNLGDDKLKIITLLSYLTKSAPILNEELIARERSSDMRYAVGMVLQHRVYEYLCVVRGWERAAGRERADLRALLRGLAQPFYSVVAIDQSDRYVAEEQLVDVARPSRLYHLEDIISREFTHFNGFAYEPNVHKQAEYPDDLAVSEQYRIRAAKLYGHDPI